MVFTEPDYFTSLTGLRFFFTFGIVLYHTNKHFGSPFKTFLAPIYRYGGFFGNYFFFELSGFLTAHTYGKGLVSHKKTSVSFLRSRITKIYPMYACSNAVSLCIFVYEFGMRKVKFDWIFRTFTMTAVGWIGHLTPFNSPTWFVNVLILLYICYAVVCHISGENKEYYVLLLLMCALLGGVLIEGQLDFPFVYPGNGIALLSYFTGTLVYELCFHSNMFNSVHLLCGACSILVVVFSFSIIYGLQTIANDFRLVIIILIIPSLLLLSVLQPLTHLLSITPLIILGKASMFLSFWHIPIMKLYKLIIRQWLRNASIPVSVSLIIYLFILYALALCWVSPLRKKYLTRKSEMTGSIQVEQ